MVLAEREVIEPAEQGSAVIEELEQALDRAYEQLQVLPGGKESRQVTPKLIFADGKRIRLSPKIVEALRFVVHHMAHGEAIALMPMHKLISTQQAADMLNVSRPFLIKLLDERAMPYTTVGSHRRLRVHDVLEYKQRRDQGMLDMLQEMADEAEEAGDYFG